MTGLFLEKLLGRPVYKISQNAPLLDVVERLTSFNIGALPVVDDSENLTGIISERDLVKAFYAFQTQEFLKLSVKKIMTRDVVRCDKSVRSEELMSLMTTKKIRHIPIVNGDTLIGIVSIGDVVKRLLEKYKDETEHLRQYIHS
tara:strand:+ start:1264 stop:1695 length:432 start_codon:yes stop_codon:yes gene_type:complete